VRANISFVVIALALAGSLAAAQAQSFPPPPPVEYYPPPPRPYASVPLPPEEVGEATEPPGGRYDEAPPVYRHAEGMPPGAPGPYGPGPHGPGYGYPPGPAQPPSARPYFVPNNGAPQQQALGGQSIPRPPADVTGSVGAGAAQPANATVWAALPPEERPEQGPAKELPPQFRRQFVDYFTSEPAGTLIIDTPHTYLYLVLGRGKALRYGIGVGREGFTWSGTERISRMSEWPDWHPPKEMIERQPYLPRFMAGGEGNPLGARALYLGNTLYRIHGTNQPSTIGSFVSSGCIRLTNEDIEDLYSRVNVGTRVVVLPGSLPTSAQNQAVH
jgi:lipoprotein-anchoring transpeptidase ErfK/SrfK